MTAEKAARVGGEYATVLPLEQDLQEFKASKFFHLLAHPVLHLEHQRLELCASLVTPVIWRGSRLVVRLTLENNSGRTVYGVEGKVKQYIKMAPCTVHSNHKLLLTISCRLPRS